MEKGADLTVYFEKCGDQAKYLLGEGCEECSLEKARKGIVLLTGKYQYQRRCGSILCCLEVGSFSGQSSFKMGKEEKEDKKLEEL